MKKTGNIKEKLQNNSNDFLRGAFDGIPIMLSYFCVSFAFGMNVCASGIPAWLAGIISITNLSSTGQFAGVNMILAHAPYVEIAVTTLIINMRYFLMSLSFSQRLDGSFNTFRRLSVSHGITDEIFALAISKTGMIRPRYMFGLIATPVFGWTLGTVIGGVFANLLPEIVVSSMSIALYGMFIAIVFVPASKSKEILFTVLLAIALSVIINYVSAFDFISGGWSIIVASVITSVIAALLFPVKNNDEEVLSDE